MHEEAKSGISVRLNRRGVVDSQTRAAAKTKAENPPPYGAQYRQDALWEGGNEALPPGWQQYDAGNGTKEYQDDYLVMASSWRPLPGIRLDSPGQLHVPGCEWYISPLGLSYFVNHNTRTTSWNKPRPEHPPGSLTPERIIEGHSNLIWNLAYLGTSRSVMSASDDGSICQWTMHGRTIGHPWRSDGIGVSSMAVSPDETMVGSGSIDGKIRLWDIEESRIIGDPWEGHKASVTCIDWSPNGQEIVSGSEDGTIRRWDPDTGRQIASPITAGPEWVYSLKYSPQGDKFMSSSDGIIRVWSNGGRLLMEIRGGDNGKYNWIDSEALCWSKDGAYIFSGSRPGTIRKWRWVDGEELIVLQGHTRAITSLCLSLDERHLISGSEDCSVRIWDLKTNRPVGEPLWHDDDVLTLVMSSDGKYVISAGSDKRIYLLNLEAALKRTNSESTHDNSAQSNAKIKPQRRLKAPEMRIESNTKVTQPLRDLTTSIIKVGGYPVARGGFGEIWKCIYSTDREQVTVAVKSLLVYASDEHSDAIEKKTKRIQREFKTCARLKHPNILAVYGYTYGFGPFMSIVSCWAENGNLTTYLEQEDTTFTLVRRFKILRDITAGLQYLHGNNVIHGDLNGPNVLIHGDGTACLADFGLSLLYSEVVSVSQASWTSTFHGNFRWLAPELIGQPENDLPIRPSKHSDIYSFGGIMLQVLTGKVPYYYLGEATVILSISTNVKPLRSRYPAFSDKYWHFIEQCWSDAAQDRPSAERVMEEVRDELDSLVAADASDMEDCAARILLVSLSLEVSPSKVKMFAFASPSIW